MTLKRKLRIVIDILMTMMLPVSMAAIITGTMLHEWIGMGMVLLFIVHHILNRKWFPSLFRGKYDAARRLSTVINIFLLISMVLMTVSGMAQSNYVFRGLYGFMSSGFARKLHLSAGWWCFIFMSMHLGMHIRVMMRFLKSKKPSKESVGLVKKICSCLIQFVVVAFGIIAFIRLNVSDYFLMKVMYAYYTDADHLAIYFTEMIMMIAACAVVGFFINEKWIPGRRK